MEFRLLGPVEAVRDGRSLLLGGGKQRALLALLLMHPNQVIARERLIEAVWPDRPPASADHSLDVQVSRLRKALAPEERIITQAGGYLVRADPGEIDVARFEGRLEAAKRANAAGRAGEALTAIDEALALWRGDVLGELRYEEFAQAEVNRLDELRLVAVEERIDAELALGRHDRLAAEIEAQVAKHQLRERLRGQLMLALYRSGRQAEALRVYADGRRRLVEELGLEPSQQLRDLEQAILRQDPALAAPRVPAAVRKRRALVGAGAFVLTGAVVAVVVGLTQGSTEGAQALAAPDSNVIVSVASGELVRASPVHGPVRVAYGDGAVWSLSETGELSRIDPASGQEVARVGLGVEPGGLAVGEGSVWVTGRTSPILFRIDPVTTRIADRFPLPMKDVVTNLTGEVVVGDSSVWVGHGGFNPGAWIERLDPETGRVQARIPVLAGDADHLAFADGALWIASSPSGELRKLDPETNEVVFVRRLQASLCCVAAGGGYAWAASNPDGVVWKVSAAGEQLPTIKLSSAVAGLAYGDGAVWAALGDEGRVARIDPITDDVRPYDLGHSVTSVQARSGRFAAGVRHRISDIAGDLSGDVVRIGRKGSELFDSGAPIEPAFSGPIWDGPQEMFHYTTCARLLTHPDSEGDAGRSIVPEVAEDLPAVSDGGRTFTFEIREGFGFSPPSSERVTAESFRHSIERSVKLTKLFGDEVRPPLSNIVGARDYHAGRARHISGITADGNKLVLRFREPQPDLPWLVAASSCAVPVETAVVEGGLEEPVASAGPYYLATLTDSLAVLRPNPNYGGSRPQKLDAILVEFNLPPSEAAVRIEDGTLDYFLESQNPTLLPDSAAARAAGDRYRLTPETTQGLSLLIFNWERPLFKSVRMRRAVQYALDRTELAAFVGSPATRFLSPAVAGYDETDLYPVRRDLRTARRLASGRRGPVVVYTWNAPGYDAAFNRALRKQLAAIGLRMTVIPMMQANGFELDKANRADLIWGGLNANTGDPGAYLEQVAYLPSPYVDEIRRIRGLSSPMREHAAAALAQEIDAASFFAVYATRAFPELRSKRLGCIVRQPEYMGVDLAALCLKKSAD
jgi:DNA-binding SARP family transcriptional activator/ABC-type transport system substrate-binding protein/outer membrane protein assembly factor BamB